jgi:hypothetical protein
MDSIPSYDHIAKGFNAVCSDSGAGIVLDDLTILKTSHRKVPLRRLAVTFFEGRVGVFCRRRGGHSPPDGR